MTMAAYKEKEKEVDYLRLMSLDDGLNQAQKQVVSCCLDQRDHLFVSGPFPVGLANADDYVSLTNSGQLVSETRYVNRL